jgi:hypothetical protein
MELEGVAPIEGRWGDRVNALDDVRVDIAMMRTTDGHGRLELTKFHSPTAVSAEPENAPANTLGLRGPYRRDPELGEADRFRDDFAERGRGTGPTAEGASAHRNGAQVICVFRSDFAEGSRHRRASTGALTIDVEDTATAHRVNR